MSRAFRFGVLLRAAADATELLNTARAVEAQGYDSLFVSDHLLGHPLGPIPALAAAAGVTERLRLGTLMLNNDLRHPLVLARDIATLDLVSGGRVELGLGAGWMHEDYTSSGIVQDPPAVRIDRLCEAAMIIRGALREGSFTFSGQHYAIELPEGAAFPRLATPPPLILGGGGRRILSLAARTADIVGINATLAAGTTTDRSAIESITPDATDRKLGWVRAAAGDRLADLDLQVLCGLVAVTDDPRGTAEGVGRFLGLEPADVLSGLVLLVGTVDSLVEELLARRARWGLNYFVVPAESAADFAPVVARLRNA